MAWKGTCIANWKPQTMALEENINCKLEALTMPTKRAFTVGGWTSLCSHPGSKEPSFLSYNWAVTKAMLNSDHRSTYIQQVQLLRRCSIQIIYMQQVRRPPSMSSWSERSDFHYRFVIEAGAGWKTENRCLREDNETICNLE